MHPLRTLTTAFVGVSLVTNLFAASASAGPIAFTKPNFFQNIGGQSLWMIDPSTPGSAQRVPVAPTLSFEHPVWSRDGKLLAGVGLLQGINSNFQGGYAVVVFDPTRNTARNVAPLGTYFGDKAYVAFSQDKTKVAYVDGSAYWSDFYVVSLTPGSQPVLLGSWSSGESDYTGTGIDWSPTGNQVITPVGIAASQCNPNALPVIVTALGLASLAGNSISSQQLLTCPPVVLNGDLYQSIGTMANDVHPVFSPDGKYVAFVRWTTDVGGVLSSNHLSSSIRILDVACRQASPFSTPCDWEVASFNDARLCGLSWSGDETKLAFDAGKDINGVPACGNLGLWMIGTDGSGFHQLQTSTASSPSWSWAP